MSSESEHEIEWNGFISASNPKTHTGLLEQNMTALIEMLSSNDTLAKHLSLSMKDKSSIDKDVSTLNEELGK